jgi:hypothetical protein
MQVTINKADEKIIRHLRGCLNSRTIDMGSLEELLCSLEGKMNPSGPKQRKRQFLRPARIVKHLNRLTGGKP